MEFKFMKHYKIIFIIAIMALICYLSFVSANELENVTNLENDGLSLEGSDFQVDALCVVNDDSSIKDNYTSSQEDDSKLRFSGGEEVLNVSNDDQLSDSKMGTSDELAKLIKDAKPGSTVTLDKDYNIRLGSSHTIEFTKAITLDGRGHTIFVYAYAFKINHPPSSAYLQIKNINFINGINGIIKNTKAAGPFIISNCNFTKPENGNNGGAIVVSGKYESYIINCTFTNCVAFPRTKVVKLETFSQIFSGASSSGGAIYSSAPITVKSCRFENCTAGDGGAVYVARSQAKIIDSVFVNNRAGRGINVESFKHGGAIYVFKAADGVLVKGCTFIGNHADRIGGAISVNSENTRIEDCIFDSNYIGTGRYNMGGAIYVTNNQETPKTSIQITRCSFNNNGYVGNEHYCKYGGAIFFSKNINGGTISYCNFTGNKVSEQGGAAYSESTCPNLKFIGCIFTKNHANDKGGAIYLDSKNNVVDGCVFDSNSADDDGGAIYVEARYNSIKNSLFTNNNAKDEGGAVYINARYTKIDLSAFTGNSAKKGYDIYCDSSYCSLTGSIILGNSPKNAIYSSSSFSASKNWWGNLASNKHKLVYFDQIRVVQFIGIIFTILLSMIIRNQHLLQLLKCGYKMCVMVVFLLIIHWCLI